MRNLLFLLVLSGVLAPPTLALADEVSSEVSPAESKQTVENAKPASLPVAVPATVVPSKAKPSPLPVYIEDWGRLAELTQADPVVFQQADFWATRREHSVQIGNTLLLVGGGVAALGTFARLTTDSWNNTTKWCVAGGLGVALISFAASWLFSPDRDDLLTVINQWNLRHPDHPLAP